MPEFDLTIIIVSFNTRDYLRKCLDSIYASINMEKYEVIVVDNCSADGSQETVEIAFPQVNLLKPGMNLGFARANNLGVKSAHGKYLLFLNPDTIVFPNTFTNMIDFMDSKPRAGAATCLILNEDGSVQLHATRKKPTVPVIFLESLGINRRYPNNPSNRRYLIADWDRRESRPVEVISGAFFMVRSNLFRELSGFDERYFMYVEDFELSGRILASDSEIWFNPSARIIHYGGKASSSFKSLATLKGITSFYNYLVLFYHSSLAYIYRIALFLAFSVFLWYYLLQFFIRDDSYYYINSRNILIIIDGLVKLRDS